MEGNGQPNQSEGMLALSPLGLPAQADPPVRAKRKYTIRKKYKGTPENKYHKKGRFKGLTARHERFVMECARCLHHGKAYMRAGFAVKNLACASAAANQLLKNPVVAAALADEMERRAKRLEISADRIAKEFACIAYSNPKDVKNENGELIPIHELPDEVAVAISSEEHDEDGSLRYRRWNKLEALANLAKMTGFWKEKRELSVTGEIKHDHKQEITIKMLLERLPEEQRIPFLRQLKELKQLEAPAPCPSTDA